jgi:hypothetical protein
MTLDEMIQQEQNKAQANNQMNSQVNTQQQTQYQPQQSASQHFASEDAPVSNNTTSAAPQTQNQSQHKGTTITTVASSSDEKVDRDQFSLRTKKWAPVCLPEDFYTVKLVGIDKKEAKAWDSDEFVPNFIWKFEVISDSTGKQIEEKVTISKWCKAFSKGENSNNYKYYMALMQETPEDGYNILDAVGKYARAYLTQYSKVDPKTGLSTKRSVIERLLPLKK